MQGNGGALLDLELDLFKDMVEGNHVKVPESAFCVKRVVDAVEVTVVGTWAVKEYAWARKGRI